MEDGVMNRPHIITVVGNIGAGKSSVVELVSRVTKGKIVPADDLFQTTDPFRDDYLRDLPRWGLANEIWLTMMRARMLRESIEANQANCLVVDSGLLMSWAYTHSHYLAGKITKMEWDLYKELYIDLTQDLFTTLHVLYLDYPLDTLMYRIKLRGRDFELACYTRQYLSEIQQGIDAMIKDFAHRKVDMLRISEIEVADFVRDPVGERKCLRLIADHFECFSGQLF